MFYLERSEPERARARTHVLSRAWYTGGPGSLAGHAHTEKYGWPARLGPGGGGRGAWDPGSIEQICCECILQSKIHLSRFIYHMYNSLASRHSLRSTQNIICLAREIVRYGPWTTLLSL